MFFSVITPAFNAADTIQRVFDSLCKQSFQDFEWIVVNDGSTDQTAAVVESFKERAPFPIQLINTPNRHKKIAMGHGLNLAQGEMTIFADADDDIPENALGDMHKVWLEIEDKQNFNSVTGLCVDQQGRLIGDPYPQSPLDCNAIEMRLRHKVQGEKWGCTLTSELVRTYPDFSAVKGHVPEGIYQRSLSEKKTRFVNQVYRVYYTNQVGSLTNSGFNPSNGHGIVLDALDWLDNYSQYFFDAPMFFIKRAASYNKYRKFVAKDARAQIRPKHWCAKLLINLTIFARVL